MRFVVATGNKGKIREIKEILREFNFDVKAMSEIGFNEDIAETGNTFEENALIKARAVSVALGGDIGCIVMADDSGLEVDFLDGAPGIYSARYAGADATDDIRVKKLLDELNNVKIEERTARFVCSIAVVFSEGNEFTVRGTCEGIIALEPKGENGFGYDPIFFVPQYNKTMAELGSQEKNIISHRGKALVKMVKKLEGLKL